MNVLTKKIFSILSVFIFTLFSNLSYAQMVPQMSPLATSSNLIKPTQLAGIHIHPNDPMKLGFLIAEGQNITDAEIIKADSERLVRYFFAALTTPNENMWVNLSPYEPERMIDDSLATTELGHTMLAQDYLLKEMTAAYLSPESETGKEFWNKIYEATAGEVSPDDVPVEQIHKIWIMPETASVFIRDNRVFVANSTLKVLLEEDFVAQEQTARFNLVDKELNAKQTELMREIILPAITKEVNEGESFVQLRQLFHAVILAKWFKQNLRDSLMTVALADQENVSGVATIDQAKIDQVYQDYLTAYETGAAEMIQPVFDPATQELIQKQFFTGGIDADGAILVETAQAAFDIFQKYVGQPVAEQVINVARKVGSLVLPNPATLRAVGLATAVAGTCAVGGTGCVPDRLPEERLYNEDGIPIDNASELYSPSGDTIRVRLDGETATIRSVGNGYEISAPFVRPLFSLEVGNTIERDSSTGRIRKINAANGERIDVTFNGNSDNLTFESIFDISDDGPIFLSAEGLENQNWVVVSFQYQNLTGPNGSPTTLRLTLPTVKVPEIIEALPNQSVETNQLENIEPTITTFKNGVIIPKRLLQEARISLDEEIEKVTLSAAGSSGTFYVVDPQDPSLGSRTSTTSPLLPGEGLIRALHSQTVLETLTSTTVADPAAIPSFLPTPRPGSYTSFKRTANNIDTTLGVPLATETPAFFDFFATSDMDIIKQAYNNEGITTGDNDLSVFIQLLLNNQAPLVGSIEIINAPNPDIFGEGYEFHVTIPLPAPTEAQQGIINQRARNLIPVVPNQKRILSDGNALSIIEVASRLTNANSPGRSGQIFEFPVEIPQIITPDGQLVPPGTNPNNLVESVRFGVPLTGLTLNELMPGKTTPLIVSFDPSVLGEKARGYIGINLELQEKDRDGNSSRVTAVVPVVPVPYISTGENGQINVDSRMGIILNPESFRLYNLPLQQWTPVKLALELGDLGISRDADPRNHQTLLDLVELLIANFGRYPNYYPFPTIGQNVKLTLPIDINNPQDPNAIADAINIGFTPITPQILDLFIQELIREGFLKDTNQDGQPDLDDNYRILFQQTVFAQGLNFDDTSLRPLINNGGYPQHWSAFIDGLTINPLTGDIDDMMAADLDEQTVAVDEAINVDPNAAADVGGILLDDSMFELDQAIDGEAIQYQKFPGINAGQFGAYTIQFQNYIPVNLPLLLGLKIDENESQAVASLS